MAMMQIKDLRKYLETAVKFKEQVDAFQFQLDLIEAQLKDILYSDDLENLPKDAQSLMIIPRVRALRYWNIQLDDYKDKHLVSLMNVLKNVKSEELNVTLEEAKRYFVTSDEIPEPFEVETVELVPPIGVRKVITEDGTVRDLGEAIPTHPVDEEEVVEEEDTPKSRAKADDEVLKKLMAAQKG